MQTFILTGFEISKLLNSLQNIKQIQSVSVELSIEKIYYVDPSSIAVISNEKTDLPNYVEVVPHNDYYILIANNVYVVQLSEEIEMPKNCMGILLPRSSLLRSGVVAQGTLVDPGYRGKPRVLTYPLINIKIEKNARLFHLIVFCMDRELGEYKGQWQGEK